MRSRRRYRFLLLGNGAQYVTGPGDMRQINFSFDFFFTAQRTERLGSLRR